MRDFTLDMYRDLLEVLISVYPTRCCRVDSVQQRSTEASCVLRHDVDRCPANALNMAKIEATSGIQATYYFRRGEISNRCDAIRAIAELGHEIAYHYEVLAVANGDFAKARRLFVADLEELRCIAPVKTVAMHGSPLSRHNNMDVWQKWQLKEFGLIGEAFQVVDDPSWVYLTDTGRSWAQGSPNIRDRVTRAGSPSHIRSTGDLIQYLNRLHPPKLCLTVHPERWNQSGSTYVMALARDMGSNFAKRIVCIARHAD